MQIRYGKPIPFKDSNPCNICFAAFVKHDVAGAPDFILDALPGQHLHGARHERRNEKRSRFANEEIPDESFIFLCGDWKNLFSLSFNHCFFYGFLYHFVVFFPGNDTDKPLSGKVGVFLSGRFKFRLRGLQGAFGKDVFQFHFAV